MSGTGNPRRIKTACDVPPCAEAEAEGNPDRIGELLQQTDPAVRRGLARNPSVPLDSLAQLAEDFPSDVLANPTLHFAFASSPGALWDWPTPSLVAIARAPDADPALLAQLLQRFSFIGYGIVQYERIDLLDALLSKANMPSSAVLGFISRNPYAEWRVRQLEVATMHPSLQPREASLQDALAAVTSCLKLGQFRTDDSFALAGAIREPTLACRAVVRGLKDQSRVAAILSSGGTASPLMEDFVKDRFGELLELTATADPRRLLRDTPVGEVGPADRQDHLRWLQSPLARRRAGALVSRFATKAELAEGLQSDRPTVRAAAEEGLRRLKLVAEGVESLTLQRHELERLQAVIRWPELAGECLTRVIRAVASSRASDHDRNRGVAFTELCISALARDDLSAADVKTLASFASDVVVRCAHSSRDALRTVIRGDVVFARRVEATRHPNADPGDVAWLRSPEGILEALACHRAWFPSGIVAKADAFELASSTHGVRSGALSRIVALVLNECPADLLVLRAKSECWIERLLVAVHASTSALVRNRLAADPCWAVRVAAKETGAAVAAAPIAVHGTKAEAHRRRSQEASRRRPLMSDIRARLSSPDWRVVQGCIREVVGRGDADVLRIMNEGIGSEIKEVRNGAPILVLSISEKSEISRRVRRGFREEAALELVRAQLGPGAPLSNPPHEAYFGPGLSWRHAHLLRKSLRDVAGLPSFEHYGPGFHLVLEHCGTSWGEHPIHPVAGLEKIVAVSFEQEPVRPDFLASMHSLAEVRGQIPVLPGLDSLTRVEGMVAATMARRDPISAVAELRNLEQLSLRVDASAQLDYSPSVHPSLRDIHIHCWSSPGCSIRIVGDHLHQNLKSMRFGNANIRVDGGAAFPKLERAAFETCSLSSGIHMMVPNIVSLSVDRCAPVPEELLACTRLEELAVEGDVGRQQLSIVPNGLKRIKVSRNADIQRIERLPPHSQLEEVLLRRCSGLRSVDLGKCMARLRSLSITEGSSLVSVLLPRSCPSLEHVSIVGCAGLRSAGDVLSGIPDNTPIKAVSFNSCDALEDVDIIARFPTINEVDLRGCKSIRSVAALRALGPGLRLKMWGASRAEGEASLGSGVVCRRQS